jgi:hypothetical protein
MMNSSRSFDDFYRRVESEVLSHQVITSNPYTKWWKQGNANTEQLTDLFRQFSVFSNHFVPIQAKRMANSSTEAAERGARAILGNEIGVGLEVESGDIEGNTFSHADAHINWLRDIGELLGIERHTLGRWDVGTPATHEFLNRLDQTYGSHDSNIGAGASFAIETWAAWGIGKDADSESNNFWKEIVVGIKGYNANHRVPKGLKPIPTGFFQYHFDIERGHAANVMTELTETFEESEFAEDKWLDGGRQALDALLIFWRGLDESRKHLTLAAA